MLAWKSLFGKRERKSVGSTITRTDGGLVLTWGLLFIGRLQESVNMLANDYRGGSLVFTSGFFLIF